MTRRGPDVELEAVNGLAIIELAETPTSGYEWQLDELPPGVRVVDDEFVDEPRGDVQIAGGSGHHVFTLDVPAGPSELVARLRRPWEATPLEERIVRITHRP